MLLDTCHMVCEAFAHSLSDVLLDLGSRTTETQQPRPAPLLTIEGRSAALCRVAQQARCDHQEQGRAWCWLSRLRAMLATGDSSTTSFFKRHPSDGICSERPVHRCAFYVQR